MHVVCGLKVITIYSLCKDQHVNMMKVGSCPELLWLPQIRHFSSCWHLQTIPTNTHWAIFVSCTNSGTARAGGDQIITNDLIISMLSMEETLGLELITLTYWNFAFGPSFRVLKWTPSSFVLAIINNFHYVFSQEIRKVTYWDIKPC